MSDFINDYIQKTEKKFEEVRHLIERQKDVFKSTDWKDEKPMILAANEIWRLEERLKDAMEIHNKILTMLG